MEYSWPRVIVGLVELGRPVNAVMGVLALFLGVSVVSGRPPTFIPLDQVSVMVLAGLLIAYSVMAVNDIVDLDVDRVNAPWRPLASGLLPLEPTLRLSIAITLLALGLTLYIEPSPLTTLAALWFLGLAHFYNFRGKRLLVVGNIIVAFLTAFPLLYGALVASYYLGGDWGLDDYLRSAVFWAMVFLAVLGREVAKGIADVEGDRRAGVKTIATVYGVRVAGMTTLAIYLTSIALSLVPAILGVVNVTPYLAVIIPVDILAFLEGLRLASNPTRDNALAHKRRVLILMLISMIGLYMGSHGV